MVATFSINPYTTTNALGSFNAQSLGYIQGMALDQPAIRYSLAGGILDAAETLPMFGGVGITPMVPGLSTNPDASLGPTIKRATSISSTIPLLGFSVFDQNYASVNFPQSPVPLTASGGFVPYYLLGSGARIVVQCDPIMATSLQGVDPINQQVSWDFNDSVLQPYDASTATYSVTSLTWSATNGGQVAVVVGVASLVGAVGDTFNLSGVTNTGTGAVGLINTTQVVNTFTDNEHFTFLLPGTSTIWGTLGGTILMNAGTGALAVKVLGFNVGNSMTVNYNAVTGFATWNRAGSTAIIQI